MFEVVGASLLNDIRKRTILSVDEYAKHHVEASKRIGNLVLHDFMYIFVVLDPVRAPYVGKMAGIYKVLLILQDDPQSVFFDLQSGNFGACWGPDMVTGEFIDLGFRGNDPVEMYLV